jgi:hypothetical protein
VICSCDQIIIDGKSREKQNAVQPQMKQTGLVARREAARFSAIQSKQNRVWVYVSRQLIILLGVSV